jgi:acetyl-CoA C-acetyltransferase
MVLAAEEIAVKICDKPIWITGVGNSIDHFFLGDRDLASNRSLKEAAQRTYKRAGITDPKTAFDVIEVSEQYAYQLPMWMEGLGFVDEGKGGQWIDDNGPDALHVNMSGGMLAGNPMILGGLVRAAEAVFQLRGEAGNNQVKNAKTALAHGVMGPAGQFHSVITLERN